MKSGTYMWFADKAMIHGLNLLPRTLFCLTFDF